MQSEVKQPTAVDIEVAKGIKGMYGCLGMIGGGCATLIMIAVVAAIHFLVKFW